MFYNEKGYSVCLKDKDGHIIAQSKEGVVRIPFNSEYSLQLKNHTDNIVAAEILIDGSPVLGEAKTQIFPDSKIEIERFCIDGNLGKGKKFKFVRKNNKNVQDPTNKMNGNIEVKFYPQGGRHGLVQRGLLRGISTQNKWIDNNLLRGFAIDQNNYPNLSSIPKNGGFRTSSSLSNPRMGSSSYYFTTSAQNNPDYNGLNGTMSCNINSDKINFQKKEETDIGATVEGRTSSQLFEEGKKVNISENVFSKISFNLKGMKKKKKSNKLENIKSNVFIVLDKSGSMSSIRQKTIEMFNQQIKELRENQPANVETRISLITFSNNADEPVFINKEVSEVPLLTEKEYSPLGSTSMLDGVGSAITLLNQLEEDSEDCNVANLVIVISDGEENNSFKYDYEQISSMITGYQNKGHWTFSYLGANQNLAEVSEKMGLSKQNVQVFTANSEGVEEASILTSSSTVTYRDNLSRGIYQTECFYNTQKDD